MLCGSPIVFNDPPHPLCNLWMAIEKTRMEVKIEDHSTQDKDQYETNDSFLETISDYTGDGISLFTS